MKIDFNKPKYILPLILLPFFCLFFYIYRSSFGKENIVKDNGDVLKDDVAEVSNQVRDQNLQDKMEAYQQRYKDGDGYTAVEGIREEQLSTQQMPDLYNQREKQMLDSIEKATKAKYGIGSEVYSSGVPNSSGSRRGSNEDQKLAEALSKLKMNEGQKQNEPGYTSNTDPMELFRKQMLLVDSMGKVNDPDYQADLARQKAIELAEKEAKTRKKISVVKSVNTDIFNTLKAEQNESFIQAIVDQNITGYSGSRLRLRLLDDMVAGRFIIKKGTYLYAQINGFSGQRVNLTISTILQNQHILPVRLEVYDNDGMPGLYVPASSFREFSKELGTNVSGMTLQQQAENNNQLVMSMLQKMFQSTSTAVTKLIRQNKAKLKYNTLVYLIDPDELKANQNNY